MWSSVELFMLLEIWFTSAKWTQFHIFQPRIFCVWGSIWHHLTTRFLVKNENVPVLIVLMAGLSARVDCSALTLISLWTEVICFRFVRYTMILRVIGGAVSISLSPSPSLKAIYFCGMVHKGLNSMKNWWHDNRTTQKPVFSFGRSVYLNTETDHSFTC